MTTPIRLGVTEFDNTAFCRTLGELRFGVKSDPIRFIRADSLLSMYDVERHRKIGRRIAALRQEKGLSQQQVADMMGTDKVVVGRTERADHSPQIETYMKIADALDVSLKELFDIDANDSEH